MNASVLRRAARSLYTQKTSTPPPISLTRSETPVLFWHQLMEVLWLGRPHTSSVLLCISVIMCFFLTINKKTKNTFFLKFLLCRLLDGHACSSGESCCTPLGPQGLHTACSFRGVSSGHASACVTSWRGQSCSRCWPVIGAASQGLHTACFFRGVSSGHASA